MEKIMDFKKRMLDNPPKCEICGEKTDLIFEGLNFSPQPPFFPIRYFLIFQCFSCGTNQKINFAIKVFSGKAITVSGLR